MSQQEFDELKSSRGELKTLQTAADASVMAYFETKLQIHNETKEKKDRMTLQEYIPTSIQAWLTMPPVEKKK